VARDLAGGSGEEPVGIVASEKVLGSRSSSRSMPNPDELAGARRATSLRRNCGGPGEMRKMVTRLSCLP